MIMGTTGQREMTLEYCFENGRGWTIYRVSNGDPSPLEHENCVYLSSVAARQAIRYWQERYEGMGWRVEVRRGADIPAC